VYCILSKVHYIEFNDARLVEYKGPDHVAGVTQEVEEVVKCGHVELSGSGILTTQSG